MHHFASRGVWKIALVVAAIFGNGPGRPKRKRRWYARPLTRADEEYLALYRKIMKVLKDNE